jgi:OmpR-family two-component system manganese-sensing sensor histidine kinase
VNRFALSLRLRFLIAYAAVFSLTLLAFALAVHAAFAASLQQQATARLAALAGAGITDVTFGNDRYYVAFRVDRILRADEEGLQWFDAHSRLVASRGLVPDADAVPHVDRRETFAVGDQRVYSYTVPLTDHLGARRGYVRASEADTEYTATLARLDRDMLVGSVLAVVLTAVGGFVLSAHAARSTEANLVRLTEFTADASHELRGPLTAIASNVDAVLRDDVALPDQTRRRLNVVAETTLQMQRLTNDLLLLARAGQPIERDLFVVDLSAVVARVQALYDAQARASGVKFSADIRPNVRVYGNPDQLQRIVANLVENAIRYAPAGGHVRVRCRRERPGAVVSVADNGPGIAPENIGRIFDRFWRGDAARSGDTGAGLGLAVALALAQRHGGTIDVASVPPAGSTFTLVLPRRVATVATAPRRRTSAARSG